MKRKTKEELSQLEREAAFKRQMNRGIRERQIYLHKVHVMAWLGYGIRVNRTLNNLSLMNIALKLLPSKNSYPDGPTCIKYFESFTKWFKTKIDLKSKNTYCSLAKLPPLATSLALQIRSCKAICYKDMVFIFVTLLRAMDVQCRIVMNFQTVPKRPPHSDLFAICTKETEEKASTSKSDGKKKVDVVQKDKVGGQKVATKKVDDSNKTKKLESRKSKSSQNAKKSDKPKKDIKPDVKSSKSKSIPDSDTKKNLSNHKTAEVNKLLSEHFSPPDKTALRHKTAISPMKSSHKASSEKSSSKSCTVALKKVCHARTE